MRLQPWQMPGWLPGAFDPLLRELPEMQYQFEQPFVMSDARIRRLLPSRSPRPRPGCGAGSPPEPGDASPAACGTCDPRRTPEDGWCRVDDEMGGTHMLPSALTHDAPNSRVAAWAGYVSLVQALLIIIPTVVLGAAIDWPISLGDPASTMLPRLLDQQASVTAGYIAYLIYSILFLVTMALLSEYVLPDGDHVLKKIIIALATASALARSIGIIRWLVPMPELARMWATASDEQQRYTLTLAYELLNAYGGTIGEVLGVSIIAACSITLLIIGGWRRATIPRWFGVTGLVAAGALLVTSADVVGIDPGPVVPVLGTTAVQGWFLLTGIWLVRRARAAGRS
jgi:hypothetical protein